MTAITISPAAQGIIQVVNESNLCKIEGFLNDTAYREAIENSSNYNSRLCRERRLRMPFLDSQTGSVAQNHSALFMSSRERLPGLLHGQIYTYPSKRWRKKRRQYLMHYLHPKRGPRGDTEDGNEGVETVTHVNDDSKDSVALKDEHSKDAWYYDEQDMLDMDTYEEPDAESDYDYEESYSSKRKRRKPRGGGHHPARNHPSSTDSPGGKRTKGGGRGRKKTNYDAVDTDKPFVCDLCSARYKTRPGLVYHYGHSHSTSSGDPAKELSPSPAEVEPRSVADTAASNQPGGTRRGRQNATSSSTSSPSPAAPSASAAGASAQPQPQSQPVQPQPQQSQQQQPQQPSQQQQPPQQQQQLPAVPPTVAPASPTIPAVKEEHLPAVPSPGTAVPSPSSVRTEGPPTPGTNEKKAGKSAQPSPYCDFCLGDARENKKTGGSEELVSCSDCGRSGHPTCLQFTANMIVSVRKYRWQCIECKCCSICGTSDNDDQLLFCDDCDRGYHMYCLSPPLASPPEGSWSCRLCIAEFHRRD
ncbi:zinc finger protein DPF3 isoform X1 [Bombus terrestris]|uniref:Zinc finger protein DPF3 isoform X1 n=1 Tax=Bombus terrestris TaxID=30195 RepID=A0A9C6W9N5_BOMTE|nr:zinc finger protein DPF3 isoform X1 [Bombus terrestris]XP_048264001.1 zinc finger protein DPF3 isoform X1 [Bombus terrestris]